MQPLRENINAYQKSKSPGTIEDITDRTAFIVSSLPNTMTDDACKRYIEAFGELSFFKRLEKPGHSNSGKRKFLVKFGSLTESVHAFEYLSTARIGSATVQIEMINNLIVESLIGDMLAGISSKEKSLKSPKLLHNGIESQQSRTERFVEVNSDYLSPKHASKSTSPLRRKIKDSSSVEKKLIHVNERRKRIEAERKKKLEQKVAQKEQQRMRSKAEQNQRKQILKEERALREKHRQELLKIKKRLNELSPNKSPIKSNLSNKSFQQQKKTDFQQSNDKGKTDDNPDGMPLSPSKWPSKSGGSIAEHSNSKHIKKSNMNSISPLNTNVKISKRHQLMSPSKISSMLFDSEKARRIKRKYSVTILHTLGQ